MNPATVKTLQQKFQVANKVGRETLDKSWSFLKERPAEAALFTLLAASIIKGQSNKTNKQVG